MSETHTCIGTRRHVGARVGSRGYSDGGGGSRSRERNVFGGWDVINKGDEVLVVLGTRWEYIDNVACWRARPSGGFIVMGGVVFVVCLEAFHWF